MAAVREASIGLAPTAIQRGFPGSVRAAPGRCAAGVRAAKVLALRVIAVLASRPMKLEGSCHCGAVRFSVESAEPVPFMRCYCSICRKTAGGGGFAINLGGDFATLKVTGRRHLRRYQARIDENGHSRTSSAQRHFCGRCGSALWLYDPTWPDLVHPHASAIDTALPAPPENVHMMLGSKAPWVAVEGRPGDPRVDAYPDFSLAEWHARQDLTSETDD